jgi:hypothetical protein
MLISKFTKIEVTKRNYNSIRKYNLLDLKIGDIVNIPISQLSKGSHYIVDVSCDYCGDLLQIPYKRYIKNTSIVNKYACSSKECSNKKTKEVCQVKYGVNNPFQEKNIKNKIKKSILEKYGVEHQMHSMEVKSKIKKTNIERYGVDNYTKTDEYKQKTTKTNLEKYGVEWTLQSKEIREKGKITNIKKYGVEYSSQSEIVREAVEKTCYEKYGYKTNLLNPYNIEKVRNTLLINWGVDNPMKSDVIKNKLKESYINKYGVCSYSKTDEYKQKTIKTNLDKYGVTNPKKNELFRKKFIIAMHKDYIKYIDNSISLFKCEKGHEFEIKTDNFFNREKNNIPLCTICNPIGDSKSIKEKELFNYIKFIYPGEIIQSYRDKLEIDIYLPELNIGFEFNGLYFHSEVFKEQKYHLDKMDFFKQKGIKIIYIWEDDWDFKNDTIKSQIKNWIGLSEHKIYARKCYVKEVTDNKVIKDFLNQNHIQGWVNSVFKLGLYYGDELVSLMVFDQYEGRKKMEESGWNLSRFCNKTNHSIVGGASKLLNYFIKLKKPTRMVSYADRTWTDGNMYYKLGFTMVDQTRPDYKYIVENKRVHKSRFRKSNLNTELTERQYMKEQGIHRIYDCGKVKFELIIK